MSVIDTISNSIRMGVPVVLQKVLQRFEPNERAEATQWVGERSTSIEEFCAGIDPATWQEAQAYGARMTADVQPLLEKLPIKMGGGGAYPFLYFLVRIIKPDNIVETGVAAGWSSRAFLQAIEANGRGHLYSSDFPYVREKNPERYVGYLVPEHLRKHWTLDIRGDRLALPEIRTRTGPIGIFHYDSDKSRAGRDFALQALGDRITNDTVVVMDDINDNLYFRDYVQKTGAKYHVFPFGGKYIGVTGLDRVTRK